MEIKLFAEDISENRFRFIEPGEISWKLKERHWFVTNNGEEVPKDWKVFYICEKCGNQRSDYNYTLILSYYSSICKGCRKEVDPNHVPLNQWTKVDGKKTQGAFEEMVSQWLYRHSVKFQTHAEIKKKVFYENRDGKRRQYRADIYLPDYDLFIEPHTQYSDFDFDRKIAQIRQQTNILVLKWKEWEQPLAEALMIHDDP